MTAIATLIDPDRLGEAALKGEDAQVMVSVPISTFSTAYNRLTAIMDDGTPHLEAWLTEEGRTTEELRLLCGLLFQITDNLPMDTRHFLDWLEATGEDQYLNEFVGRRTGHLLRKGRAAAVAQHLCAAATPGQLGDLIEEISLRLNSTH